MRPEEFFETRKGDWEKLTRLLDRCQHEIKRLSPEEVHTLGYLYRSTAADLALAQRDFPGHRLTVYLNQLVARAHAVIYRSEPLAFQRICDFITTGYPRAYRQALPFILISFAAFIIPALIAGWSATWNPDSARWLLPAQVQNVIPDIERQELWVDIPVQERPFASSFIMQNNIQVAFLSFTGGVFAGIGTLWVMLSNGLTLGGVLGLTAHYGIGFDLLTFVIGHGVIELSVVFISGGAGLIIGWAIIHPGLLRRQDALALAGRRAVRLVIGCVPLLVIAGLIEGFISPAESLPWTVKWCLGLGSGVLLYAYLLFSGRKQPAGAPM
jgi:uncharacterized membrane protein SpoIIM required for sporulation